MDSMFTKEDIDRYKQHLMEEEKSRSTVEKYIRDIYKLYYYLESSKTFEKQELLIFKEQLQRTLSAATVNSVLAAVNGFLKYLGRDKLQLKRVRMQRQIFCSAERELTKEEYKRLLKAATNSGNERLYMVMQTLCGTGIRISELEAITVSGVRAGTVNVSCKGKNRKVFIPVRLKQHLLHYIKCNQIDQGPVFVTRSGKPLDRSNIWREMKQLCASAGVAPGKVFPHNLRHLFARSFYRQQKDIVRLADILGHSNVETTRIYTISSGKEYERQIGALGLII